jgi:hypothetical protein
MLAGVCHLLGVRMVFDSDFDSCHGEDPTIIRSLLESEEAFAQLVSERNELEPSWGFKWPGRWENYPLYEKWLREPMYLSIWKDPVSVTRRRFGTSQHGWMRKLRNTARQMQGRINDAYRLQVPLMTFSYHKAIMAPGRFIREVGEAIGIEPTWQDVARIGQWIQPNLEGPKAKYPKLAEFL